MRINAVLTRWDLTYSYAVATHIDSTTDNDIEVCVIEREPHVLISACRLSDAGWIDARTKRLLDIHPTHWREWQLGTAGLHRI